MAAVITTSALALCANAAFEEETFSARYVNSSSYVPGNVNISPEVRLVASADEYTGVVTYMTDLVNRSVTITSLTHPIINTPSRLVFNNTNLPRTWEIDLNNESREVVYKVEAYTNVYAILNAEGYISRG